MPAISIIEAFPLRPDRRMDRGKRHSLSDIVVQTLCGALWAVDNWVEFERLGGAKLKWFRTFWELPNGVPAHGLAAGPCRCSTPTRPTCRRWTATTDASRSAATGYRPTGGVVGRRTERMGLVLVIVRSRSRKRVA